MPKATVRRAEIGDGAALFPNLRPADKREIIAGSGKLLQATLDDGIRTSEEGWAVVLEDETIALYGYRETDENSAFVWMLGSEKILDIRWQFLRATKNTIKQIMKKYDSLWSLSYAKNTAHSDWYKWAGFKVMDTIDAGPFDLPFNYILLTKEEDDG